MDISVLSNLVLVHPSFSSVDHFLILLFLFFCQTVRNVIFNVSMVARGLEKVLFLFFFK